MQSPKVPGKRAGTDEPDMCNLGMADAIHALQQQALQKEHDDEIPVSIAKCVEEYEPLCAHGKLKVLIVGDGDFRYTLAFARLCKQRGWDKYLIIVATVLQSICEMEKTYSLFSQVFSALLELSDFVRLCFQVDATRLGPDNKSACDAIAENSISKPDKENESKGIAARVLSTCSVVHSDKDPFFFDRIVWNFPHSGGKSKAQVQRQLMFDFFASARNVLAGPQSQIFVTLKGGQGGTFAERKRLTWGDTWQIQDKAASAGLLLKDVVSAGPAMATLAETDSKLGYSQTGFHAGDKAFHMEYPLSHIFMFPSARFCPEQKYPLRWPFSLGFDIHPPTFSPQAVYDAIRRLKPGLQFEIEPYSEFFDKTRNRHTLTWHFVFISSRVPLAKHQSHVVMVELKQYLDELAAIQGNVAMRELDYNKVLDKLKKPGAGRS